jgi:hypothetical protein
MIASSASKLHFFWMLLRSLMASSSPTQNIQNDRMSTSKERWTRNAATEFLLAALSLLLRFLLGCRTSWMIGAGAGADEMQLC